ncbi:hypothetical protein D3C77_537830 [compost metagenome]
MMELFSMCEFFCLWENDHIKSYLEVMTCKQVQLNGLTQRKALALSKSRTEMTYSFISARSRAKASKLWTKVNAFSST